MDGRIQKVAETHPYGLDGNLMIFARSFARQPCQPDSQPSDPRLLAFESACSREFCPTCGVYFPDLSSMRKHQKRKHSLSLLNHAVRSSATSTALDLSKYTVNGMARCSHCLKTFIRPPLAQKTYSCTLPGSAWK